MMNTIENKKTAWLTCLVAALFPFYSFFQMNLFNVIGPFVQQKNDLSLLSVGLLSASFLYAQAACLIVAGLLLDRFSIKRLIIMAMFLLATGTLLFTYSHSIFLLFFARILTGIAHSFSILGCFQMIARWFPLNQHAFLMGIAITIALLGGLVAQTPFLLLINALGIEQAMFINVMGGYVIVIILSLVLRSPPALMAPNNTSPTLPVLPELKTVAANLQNWLCGFYASIMSLPMLVLGAAWGVAYLSEAQHLSTLHATLATVMIFLGMIIGSPLAGALADFSKYKNTVLVMSPLLMALLFLAVIFLPSVSAATLLTLFFIIGLLSGAQLLVYPMIVQNNSPQVVGLALGFSSTIIMLGGALAQTSMSALAAAQGFSVAILLLPVTLMLCFIIALSIKQKAAHHAA